MSVAKLIVKLMGERETIKLFEKSAGSVSFSSIIHLNQFGASDMLLYDLNAECIKDEAGCTLLQKWVTV